MRGKPITFGDIVRYRLYNFAESKSYGPTRRGKVIETTINASGDTRYLVIELAPQQTYPQVYPLWLYRREIKKVLDK